MLLQFLLVVVSCLSILVQGIKEYSIQYLTQVPVLMKIIFNDPCADFECNAVATLSVMHLTGRVMETGE